MRYPVWLDCFLLLLGIWPSKAGRIKALFIGSDLLKYVRAGAPPDYASDRELEKQDRVMLWPETEQWAWCGMVHLLGGLLARFPVGSRKRHGSPFGVLPMLGNSRKGYVLSPPWGWGDPYWFEESTFRLPNQDCVRGTSVKSKHFLICMEGSSFISNEKPNIPMTCFLRKGVGLHQIWEQGGGSYQWWWCAHGSDYLLRNVFFCLGAVWGGVKIGVLLERGDRWTRGIFILKIMVFFFFEIQV